MSLANRFLIRKKNRGNWRNRGRRAKGIWNNKTMLALLAASGMCHFNLFRGGTTIWYDEGQQKGGIFFYLIGTFSDLIYLIEPAAS